MKLQEIIENPDAFMYMERYVNEGSRTYSPFSKDIQVLSPYSPLSETKSFKVPLFRVPRSAVTVFLGEPDPELSEYYVKDDSILFPIHPEIASDTSIPYIAELIRFPREGEIAVVPTSSTRTVFAKNHDGLPPHFLKLHYPRRISRFIRNIRRKVVENSIEVSRDLLAMPPLSGVGYLSESIGLAYGDSENGWGVIIRESTPRPYQETGKYLIPYFALYSQDRYRDQDEPLLVQLVRFLNAKPEEFIFSNIMLPLIKSWCEITLTRGILLESHGQNTLLELNGLLEPTRIIHRDFAVRIDPEVRALRKLSMPFVTKRIGIEAPHPKNRIYSLLYDHFISHHLFDYIAQLAETKLGVSRSLLYTKCKEAFHSYFPDASSQFPKTTFYYSPEILPDNQSELVDTNQLPNWR